MHETENLNTYMVRFRTMGKNNIPNMTMKKSEIKAISPAAAIGILKEMNPAEIRIDKVEQLNKLLEVKAKKKRSVAGYIFLGFLAAGTLIRAAQKLFFSP